MAHVTLAEIQAWLESTKSELSEIDVELEADAFSQVSGALNARYNVSLWTNETTTPRLIRSVISLFVAAWTWSRQYGEIAADVTQTYGRKLESSAKALLGGLADGSISLTDGTAAAAISSSTVPTFFPNAIATQIAEDSGPDAEGGAVRAFSMGKTF